MKKVIVKCRVNNKDRFSKKLSDINMDFSPIYWMHDRIYVPRTYKRGMNLPRLVMRTEMKAVDKPPKYTLILKRHIENSGIDIVEETNIKDYTEAVNIILQLGFKLSAEVSRRRQMIKMDDSTVIYLDNIDGKNGYYAKIETEVKEGEEVKILQEDLSKTMAVLGENNVIDSAYLDI